MDLNLESTGWRIAGASGATATIGTPVVEIEVGGSYIRMPVENVSTGDSVMLKGLGVGAAMGVGVGLPFVSASGSLDEFPADGIGEIYKGKAGKSSTFQASDFFGEMMVFGMSAGSHVSGGLSGALWLDEPVGQCAIRMRCTKKELKMLARQVLLTALGASIPAANAVAKITTLAARTKAAGCFYGMNFETQIVGAGVDVFTYRVKA